MANSLIMVGSTTSSDVLENGVVPMNTILRRRGKVLTSNNDNILLNMPGYYKLNASVTFTSTETGVATIVVQKNNITIPGLTASTSVETATTEVSTLNVSGIVRVNCGEGLASISLVNIGIPITTSNVEIDMEYLG